MSYAADEGSIPSGRANQHAGLAQLVEHLPCKQGVVSSSLTAGTINQCPGGGIGRRAGFKIQYRKVCGFESHPGHHSRIVRALYGCMNFVRDTYGYTAHLTVSGWPQLQHAPVRVYLFDVTKPPTVGEASALETWLEPGELQEQVQRAALLHLFEHRLDQAFWFDLEDENILDQVAAPEDFLRHLTLRSVELHGLSDDGRPYFGLSFDCSWDDEHGAGVMMLGAECLKWGGADTASLEWIARQHAERCGFHPFSQR